METKLNILPPKAELETPKVLKQLAKSHRYLAELKGSCKTIPNESILIDTLTLQEAKDSSEVENIVTTHDDLYKEHINLNIKNLSAKEVYNYATGLKKGFHIVRDEKLLLNKHILSIHKELLQNDAGFRTQSGTKLLNSNNEVVYTPPQDANEILNLMGNLERYINDDEFSDVDDLIKMAVIHYQFESIHPFYDGNGRTGRIVNILYLVLKGLLDIPILYLSRYITQNKADYYKVLQGVRKHNDWESLILYLLKGVEVTAKQTIYLVENIKILMREYKNRLRNDLPKIYSQDLLNILFKNPYTKTEFLERELMTSKRTALNYLNAITEIGLLEKVKKGKTNYYTNTGLVEILMNVNNTEKNNQ
ncbi:MAG: Fic family protein [Flavobacteriaceae bacterium]|nr:Fic family protein [Flavobacteriaceae bacterium]